MSCHPDYYKPDDLHPIRKIKNKEIYNKTINKENIIKKAGYKLVVIWEHEWKKLNKKV
ncbi:hypothetical protein Klosneuvirus_1_300 [Klosneuvirus KNV1]|uniref:Uncharacterized protein n=1 Tax=Klosneuvirus KNV1 TaxID=1977640 RepID=A0A1V0SI96_9VIRU|nr:hypothetical protein Klosneuvirus_1_300 [Klosneuvirus KNV1]